MVYSVGGIHQYCANQKCLKTVPEGVTRCLRSQDHKAGLQPRPGNGPRRGAVHRESAAGEEVERMLEIGREVELRDLPRLLSPGLGIVVKKVGGNGSVELLSEPLRECWDLQCRAVEARILGDEEAEIILGAGFPACNRRTCPYQESCTGML